MLGFLKQNTLNLSNCCLFVQSKQWKYQNNVLNLFKVENKDNTVTSLLLTLNKFQTLYCVSIVDFEHVNANLMALTEAEVYSSYLKMLF